MTAFTVTDRRRNQGACAWDAACESCPSGKSGRAREILSSPVRKNKSLVYFVKSALESRLFRCVGGDVSRSSWTSAAECDGRVSLQRDHSRGRTAMHARSSRAVLAPRCWCPAAERAKRIVAHGGQKPAHRGEREAAVKTIAQGGPGVFGQTCGTCRLHFFSQAGHGRGQRPAFPAPSVVEEGEAISRARAQPAAGLRTHVAIDRRRWGGDERSRPGFQCRPGERRDP